MAFQPGISGNPKGPRHGPRFGHAALEKACRQHVAPVVGELVERVTAAALQGDTAAAAALVTLYGQVVGGDRKGAQ